MQRAWCIVLGMVFIAAACFAALDAAGLSYAAIRDRETGEGCGFENAARL